MPSKTTPDRNPAGLAVKGAGLVAIAVVSGLLWWLIRHEDAPAPVAQPPAPAGQFEFKIAEGPVVATDCEGNSYGKTKDFFGQNQCSRVSRALYTTGSGAGKALVSVVLVTMPDPAGAAALKALTDRDGTGNVSDLVRDGAYKAAGAPKVSASRAAYQSRVNGAEVAVVLADFFDQHIDKAQLKRITAEALDLSGKLRG
ncbi:hypothetical protein [Amycolatopsis sp. H20-H5]|uniref:hypothetical protein n=1 Tax=Amycolatopsis sp. H20-H5 TaxID=3046309 RepID=UPI002DBDBF35|nr:hypothetical protein [Amycolatopsis sp. H20-H5]MEC3977477.1 hypothetical protein [Amycolatopsis sp. H20-H5]